MNKNQKSYDEEIEKLDLVRREKMDAIGLKIDKIYAEIAARQESASLRSSQRLKTSKNIFHELANGAFEEAIAFMKRETAKLFNELESPEYKDSPADVEELIAERDRDIEIDGRIIYDKRMRESQQFMTSSKKHAKGLVDQEMNYTEKKLALELSVCYAAYGELQRWYFDGLLRIYERNRSFKNFANSLMCRLDDYRKASIELNNEAQKAGKDLMLILVHPFEIATTRIRGTLALYNIRSAGKYEKTLKCFDEELLKVKQAVAVSGSALEQILQLANKLEIFFDTLIEHLSKNATEDKNLRILMDACNQAKKINSRAVRLVKKTAKTDQNTYASELLKQVQRTYLEYFFRILNEEDPQ